MPRSAISNPQHIEILEWFHDRAGLDLEKWPDAIGDRGDLFLVNRAKGIHKPRILDFAVSLRVAYGDRYGDGPDMFEDNSWRLFYHVELRKGQSDVLSFNTNKAVLKCMNEQVPIGVIQQTSLNPVRCRVFGLGIVTGLVDNHFVVEGPVPINGLSTEGFYRPRPDPDELVEDARRKVLQEVYRRQGQGHFRKSLLRAYEGRCAITNCDITELLDAAHILPHRRMASNITSNGILLRTDIHTLFDLGLIEIDPRTLKCEVRSELKNSETYAALDGVTLREPVEQSDRPDREYIEKHNLLVSKSSR
ncbi:MAG: HNH endonuclease [Pseudomonadota bacterium]